MLAFPLSVFKLEEAKQPTNQSFFLSREFLIFGLRGRTKKSSKNSCCFITKRCWGENWGLFPLRSILQSMDPVLFFDSPLSMETNLVLFAGWEDLVFSFKAWVLILEREDKLSVRTSNCHGSLYLTILYVKPTSGRLPSSGFLSLELEHYPSPYLVPRTFP
ncbi:UNVERIFIED_CONTAM: hypothetical protein Sindi_2925900, partial [Sesamum indicum]